jgi:hypothetical protein
MLRSKKFWLIIFSLLVIAGFAWYFIFSHSAPAYSRYIPRNAVGVVTFNTKRLASDFLFSGEWKQDTSGSAHKLADKWTKAVQRNGGAGISLSSDILLFSEVSVQSRWYNGAILEVDDAKKLSSFLTKELPGLLDTVTMHVSSLIHQKNFESLILIDDEGIPVWIGFNQEAVIFLKTNTSSSGVTKMDQEMARLFNLSKDSSILSDRNFVRAETRGADISFWCNYNHPELKHIFRNNVEMSTQPGYVDAWLNFNKGEVKLEVEAMAAESERKEVFRKTNEKNNFLNYVDEHKLMALLHLNINPQNLVGNLTAKGTEGKLDHLFDNWGLKTADVTSCINGEVDGAWQGYVHYQEKYIAYERDENFNETEVERFRDARMPALTFRIGVNPAQALTNVLPKLVAGNKISVYKNGFKLNSSIPVYFFPSGNSVFVTTQENAPLGNSVTSAYPDIEKQMEKHSSCIFLPVKNFKEQLLGEYHFPDQKDTWDAFESLSIVADENPEGKTKFVFKLEMKDEKTNSLAQLIRVSAALKKKN